MATGCVAATAKDDEAKDDEDEDGEEAADANAALAASARFFFALCAASKASLWRF